VGGGRWGGPARVATVLRRLRDANPATIAVLAGDLLSPSALGTARVDGQRLDGRHMVDVLNVMGLDYATFGNHEFDLSERALHDRLAESRFRWLSANVMAAGGQALPGVTPHVILRIGQGRDTLRVALFGATMDRDAADYARVDPPVEAAAAHARLLRDSADVIVAITHLPRLQDIALAERAPEIDLIAGGHDHENLMLRRGEDLTPIAKADANARTLWIHDIIWNTRVRKATIDSRLLPITDTIPEDAATRRAAQAWQARAYDGFRQAGFQPDSLVAVSPLPLDGLESSVLADTTALTHLIAAAMLAEAGTQAAVYNAGSIRIDDVLPPGSITQYDVIRVLPFGGPVVVVEMRGALLRRMLDQGLRNRGTGGFLQRAGIAPSTGGDWVVAGSMLNDGETYRLAVSDFLLSGREQGMDWLTRQNPDVRVLRELRDIRLALIDELRRQYPGRDRRRP
jgi:5'-nucleotidase